MKKINKSTSKKKSISGGMVRRKLKRSLQYGVGKNRGRIKGVGFTQTKSGRDAVEFDMLDPYSGRCSKFLILLDCAIGEALIDSLMDIFDIEEVYPEELEGMEVGFETQMKGSFMYIKSFFPIDDYSEEDDDESEDEELELEEEEFEEEDLELEDDDI